MKLGELQRAEKEFDLKNDEDFKAAEKAGEDAREELKKAKIAEMKNELKLGTEEQEEVKELVKEAGEIDTSIGENGMISYEDYLKIFGAIISLHLRQTERIDAANRNDRRAALV